MQFKSDIQDNIISLLKDNNSTFKYLLPGIVQSIYIGGEIIFDSETSANKESHKIATGYKEKTIQVSLLLLPTKSYSSYQLLKQLEKLFKTTEEEFVDSSSVSMPLNSIIPISYTINNKHINSRGINKVYFSSLGSSEDNNKNYISVTINFIEIIFPSYTKKN